MQPDSRTGIVCVKNEICRFGRGTRRSPKKSNAKRFRIARNSFDATKIRRTVNARQRSNIRENQSMQESGATNRSSQPASSLVEGRRCYYERFTRHTQHRTETLNGQTTVDGRENLRGEREARGNAQPNGENGTNERRTEERIRDATEPVLFA